MKHKGSPESVGRGAAIGLLTGFVVPFSLQMPFAFPLAILFKAAKLPALVFTWISNPLTIPFIYPLQCYVGSCLIGHPFSYASLRTSSAHLIETPTLGSLMGFGREVVISFFVGGLFFGSIAALFGYIAVVYLVRRHREKHKIRKERKAFRVQRGQESTNEIS
jgi:uncharacterized protein (DUF2062 family)